MTLLRANPGASRRFYQLAVTHLSVGDVVKFILSIQAAVVQCVRSEGVEGEGEGVRQVSRGRRGDGDKKEEDMESSESDRGNYMYKCMFVGSCHSNHISQEFFYHNDKCVGYLLHV